MATHPHVATPKVVVECPMPKVMCEQSGVQQTVPAGHLLNDHVLAPYNTYSCTTCGSHMMVTGNAPQTDS